MPHFIIGVTGQPRNIKNQKLRVDTESIRPQMEPANDFRQHGPLVDLDQEPYNTKTGARWVRGADLWGWTPQPVYNVDQIELMWLL